MKFIKGIDKFNPTFGRATKRGWKYTIEEDDARKYFVNYNNFPDNLVTDRQKIIDYSQGENKIIEIYEINKNPSKIVTKYYDNYFPMVITENCSFYPQDTFERCSNFYDNFMSDIENIKNLYTDIISEMRNFVEITGYYFSDISSNNIIVNENFTDYRIIDVSSLKPITEKVFIEPLDLMICSHREPEFIKYVKNLNKISSNVGDIKGEYL
jgi:hypothetical protein|tara:strand:- start:673 stop:1305 length:633 start_codon:yes stop_codon:yes gene_type:complete